MMTEIYSPKAIRYIRNFRLVRYSHVVGICSKGVGEHLHVRKRRRGTWGRSQKWCWAHKLAIPVPFSVSDQYIIDFLSSVLHHYHSPCEAAGDEALFQQKQCEWQQYRTATARISCRISSHSPVLSVVAAHTAVHTLVFKIKYTSK